MDEQQQFTVDVKRFVERMLARQDAFEAKVNKRLAKTDKRIEEIFRDQQKALRDATETLKAVIEEKTGWKRPESAASSN
jgi:CII-binding regulator of phage lambda lysogenization HflD